MQINETLPKRRQTYVSIQISKNSNFPEADT